jgi:hypothetical protein
MSLLDHFLICETRFSASYRAAKDELARFFQRSVHSVANPMRWAGSNICAKSVSGAVIYPNAISRESRHGWGSLRCPRNAGLLPEAASAAPSGDIIGSCAPELINHLSR